MRNCVSLQDGVDREQAKGTSVLDLLPKKPSWEHTAALIACLDVVKSAQIRLSVILQAQWALTSGCSTRNIRTFTRRLASVGKRGRHGIRDILSIASRSPANGSTSCRGGAGGVAVGRG